VSLALFWARVDYPGGTVWGANADGSGATQLVAGLANPSGVAVDQSYVYWVEYGGPIGRANIGGGYPMTIVTGAYTNGSSTIAIDSSYVYWCNSGGNSIGRASLNGTGTPDPSFIPGAERPVGVAVDSVSVY